jgi:hypothetical protein
MERALFPSSVEVDQNHLAYAESTKIDQILARTLAIAQMGVTQGLRVSANTINSQLLDVTAGEAYVQNGERAILATSQVGLALADNTNGVVNLVVITYTETEIQPEPHENGATILKTKVSSAGVVSVITNAAYEAMTTSDQDKIAIVAIVVATGGSIPGTAITQPAPYIAVLAPSQPSLISGVSITLIDFQTQPGNGTLDFDASPANGVSPTIPAPRIRWQAPGEGAPGPYVSISQNGSYNLVSSTGRTLTIAVIAVNLPLIDQSETIVVESLYTIPAPRFTAADYLHRTMVGSGAPSARNPHGLTFADLGGSPTGQVEEHQLFMHSNGIFRGSSEIFLSTAVVPVFGPSPDFISITSPVAGDTYHVNGKVLTTLSSNQIEFLSSVSTSVSLYDLLLNEGGNPSRALRLEHPASPTITGVAIIDCDESLVAGTYDLTYDRTAKTLQFNNGPLTLVRGDGNYAVYDEDGNRILVNVGESTELGFGVLPTTGGPTFTDSITVYAIASRKIFMRIGNVVWDGAGALGWTESLVNAKVTIDKREFGTLGSDQIRDDLVDADEKQFPATYTVGDGTDTFGDFNGPSAIQMAIDTLGGLGQAGTIFVKPGTYDPFTINVSDIALKASAGVIVDGINSTLTPGGCITVAASRTSFDGFRLKNAAYGVVQTSGNDNRGTGLIFDSSLGARFSYTAGLRNLYRDTANSCQKRTISSNTVLTPFDEIVLVTASCTVTMPPAAACVGRVSIKKMFTAITAITVLPDGSDLFDGVDSTLSIDVYRSSLTFEPNTGGWLLV